MRRRRMRRVLQGLLLTIALVAARWGVRRAVWAHRAARRVQAPVTFLDEAAAKAAFARRFPGRRPLNEAIGDAAVRFHAQQPMGKFVLGLSTPGNDCSDFVACCVDEGLGVKARFRRGSQTHLLGERWSLFEIHRYTVGMKLLPGDELAVRHSPWYAPSRRACWHVGIVGSDGLVYDFVKLRRWKQARYGRNKPDWFVRQSLGVGQCEVFRLHWRYRYAVDPLPAVADPGRPYRPGGGELAGPEG